MNLSKQSTVRVAGWHVMGAPGARRHEHDGVITVTGPREQETKTP